MPTAGNPKEVVRLSEATKAALAAAKDATGEDKSAIIRRGTEKELVEMGFLPKTEEQT